MKYTLSLAYAATLGYAASLEEGYVIDLCPSDEPVTAINMPSNTQILSHIKAFDEPLGGRWEGAMSGRTVGAYDNSNYSKMLGMWKADQMMKEVGAAYEREQMKTVGESCPFLTQQGFAATKGFGSSHGGYAAKNLVGGYEGEQLYYPGSTTALAAAQLIAPAAYNLPVGIIERESFLPGAIALESNLARIPGAMRDDTYITPGFSFEPDSYTPGSYEFSPSCMGQAVTVYPEREQKVLWCGERNLQGNQTLKRTNVHHNYVHDINHEHNYHNRTRHGAKQYNTVEKDCSCKGVAVEASYKCPPGIEAPSARAVGSSFIQPGFKTGLKTVGTTGYTSSCGLGSGLNTARVGAIVGNTEFKSCDCAGN